MKAKAHFLPGKGRHTESVNTGVVHYVVPVNGDNMNTALCGKKPTGKSLGWAETSKTVSCEKCLKLRESV